MGATEGFMKAQIEQLKEENKRLKLDLEQRVAELERLVKELIENKEDKRCIMIDKDGTPIGEEKHDYHSDFIYRM